MIHAFLERGKSEECLKQGKIVADSGAVGVEALLARGEAYLFGGLEHKAIPLFKQAMAEDPANAAALFFLTAAADWAGQFQEAIQPGETYLTRLREDPEVHLWLAVAHHSLGNLEKAELHYQRSLDLLPPNTAMFYELYAAVFFRQIGQADRADRILLDTLDLVEQKLGKYPDNWRLRDRLAGYYGLLGDAKRLREEEALILREFPDSGFILTELALAVGAMGDKRHFVELSRLRLAKGTVEHFSLNMRALYPDKELEQWPGVQELLAEHTAAVKRLEALY